MLARVRSVATMGLEAKEVVVEVDVATKGFPAFEIVGLPDKAVAESRARVRKAIENSGYDFPSKRITVNLAPADLRKEGSNYDLPIAVGILIASEIVRKDEVEGYFYGELGLDGGVKHCRGVLLVAMLARKKGVKSVYVSVESASEGAVVEGVEVYPVRKLERLVRHLNIEEGKEKGRIKRLRQLEIEEMLGEVEPAVNMCDIVGQEMAKRAAEIAAAGGHNLLLVGPPGAGKTMLAKAFPSILPALSVKESLEVSKIYSVAGMMPPMQALVRRRPYRAPHHTASRVSMIGGGSNPMPGEISLAHLGVLFLDELPEFPRSTLEVLRQPLEDGVVQITRVAGRAEYPASFTLLASANPCPCGYFNHPSKECGCGLRVIEKYRQRLSGPILDRVDLHVWVDPVEVEKLAKVEKPDGESSEVIRERVKQARERQGNRLADHEGIYSNAQMSNKLVKEYCQLSDEVKKFLLAANVKYELSARAYFKVLKVARTIADLSGDSEILLSHVAEAVQYRESVW